MSDDDRAELRRGIEAVVRATLAGKTIRLKAGVSGYTTIAGAGPFDEGAFPALTPFQQMCLSGLLGDTAMLPQALADYMIDIGHEYATACYEKGKRDGTTAAGFVKFASWQELTPEQLQDISTTPNH